MIVKTLFGSVILMYRNQFLYIWNQEFVVLKEHQFYDYETVSFVDLFMTSVFENELN